MARGGRSMGVPERPAPSPVLPRAERLALRDRANALLSRMVRVRMESRRPLPKMTIPKRDARRSANVRMEIARGNYPYES